MNFELDCWWLMCCKNICFIVILLKFFNRIFFESIILKLNKIEMIFIYFVKLKYIWEIIFILKKKKEKRGLDCV